MARNDAEAFRFPEHTEPLPELTDEVDRLWTEGKHRSALDVILGFLRTQGRSAEAFRWAMPLLGNPPERADPSIAEPITRQQYRSPYFAPIATECARCTAYWYSRHVLVEDRRLAVVNPVGQQCPACRYTLCRDCIDPENRRCPEEGCSGELGVPVLPTGRPRGMPANEFTDKLEHILILWRDTPADLDEAAELVDLACTWQDFGGITVRSQVSQADGEDEEFERRLGLVLVALHEREGFISEGGLYRTRVVPIGSPGRGRRLLFVTAAPETGSASRLSGPVKYLLSGPSTLTFTPEGIAAVTRMYAGKPAKGAQPRKHRWFRRGH